MNYARKDFHLLLAGQFTVLLGDRVTTLCLVTLAGQLATDSFRGAAASMIAAIQVTALLIFSYGGGMLADRFDKRHVLTITALLRSAVILLVALVLFQNIDIKGVFLLVFLLGTLSGIFNPTRKAFLPFVVAQTDLSHANRLLAASDISAMMLGIGAGILLLQALPVQSAILVDSVCFFFGALAFLAMSPTRTSTPTETKTHSLSLTELKEGFRYLQRHAAPKLVLTRVSLPFYLAAGFFYSATNQWAAEQQPDNTGLALGQVLLPLCMGALSVAAMGRWFDRHRPLFIPLAAYALGIPPMLLLALFASQSTEIVALLMFPIGMTVGALYLASTLFLHQTVDKEYLGRIMGIHEWIASGAFVLSVSISAMLFSGIDAETGWILTALVYLVGSLLLIPIHKKIPQLSLPIG